MRTLLEKPPYPDTPEDWSRRGRWPASWIALSGIEPPFVSAFRLVVELSEPRTVRVHVTADERYELFLNGERVGRGSERGDAGHWFFETYDLPLLAGRNTLVAKVWALGVEGDALNPSVPLAEGSKFARSARAPHAQMSVYPGFLFSPDDPSLASLLATGKADWQAKTLGGFEFKEQMSGWGTGARLVVHGDEYDWGFERGEGEGWGAVRVLVPGMDDRANDANPGHCLRPAMLPAQMDEVRHVGAVRNVSDPGDAVETTPLPILEANNLAAEQDAWQGLVREGRPIVVPPHTRRRVILDLENYYCAYPEVATSGGRGSSVRVHWEESLWIDAKASAKGNRDEVEGKFFTQIWHAKDGVGDTFLPDGGQGRRFGTLWWECGRYVEIVVSTADEPLTIESLSFRETRYPLEVRSFFEASDPRFAEAAPIMVRALQMCSHETYMDCPFYEQLMYAGDTRLEVLATYVLAKDDRLPRKALRLFDASRLNSGITQSRYPSRVQQIIPPFSLWWIAMIHDFALWRGDMEFVRERMSGARAVLDAFRQWTNEDGLIQGPNGWNYTDWVPNWEGGIPPDGNFGVSAILNLHAAFVLRLAAQLEGWLGEPELSARNHHWADRIMEGVRAKFWNRARGCYADNLDHSRFSEHAQCLAILEGSATSDMRESMKRTLLEAPDLERTTIYFSHYLFEAYRVLGLGEAIVDRLGLWFDLVRNGLKTTIEHPEPTRSDCHAWGAHPLFHFFATFAGIRPTKPGFAEIEIRPLLGGLASLHAKLPTPRGSIELKVGGQHIDVFVPEGITGTVVFDGERRRIG